MSAREERPKGTPSLRDVAARKLARRGAVDLDALTPSEVRVLVHELEVHKLELELQNEQLQAAQEAAEEAKERYRRLYDSAPIGFVTLDRKETIVEANLGATALLKSPRSRVVGRKFSKFLSPWHQDRWYLARRRLAQGERQPIALELARADGSTVPVRVVGGAASARDARRGSLSLALMDVTELQVKERALREAASALTLAEQQERRKLAADLHDDAGQLLTLVSLKLHALVGLSGEEKDAGLRGVEEILAEVRRRISTLSFQLSPPLLHDVGLVAAIEWLAEDLQARYGLLVQITEREEPELDEGPRISLYRAVRELLINVTKHAGVEKASVRIWREDGMARVAVEDAGVGLSSDVGGRGFGLLAIRERLVQMGGSLEIGSVLGIGTRVVASVPLISEVPERDGGASS